MTSNRGSSSLIAGSNQVKKAVMQEAVSLVYVACDAETSLRVSVLEMCRKNSIPTDESKTAGELGAMCGIDVKCAVCGLKR